VTDAISQIRLLSSILDMSPIVHQFITISQTVVATIPGTVIVSMDLDHLSQNKNKPSK